MCGTSESPGNILLIGFMGAGKSTVGPVLSRRLKCEYVDIDNEITRHDGRSIPEIFQQDGEERFRQLESEVLELQLSRHNRRIIGTGGGIVSRECNWETLRSLGTTIYLEAPFALLLERIGSGHGRPLASDGDKERLSRLFRDRAPLYALADIVVSTLGRNPDEVAEMILLSLKRRGVQQWSG